MRMDLGVLKNFQTWYVMTTGTTSISCERDGSKKSVQQGRSLFHARSVLAIREHGKTARTQLAAFFNSPYFEFAIRTLA